MGGLHRGTADALKSRPNHRCIAARPATISTRKEHILKTQKATFAAGCFWGVEAAFRRVPGVLEAPVGYTGGHVGNPGYREVCGGRTGHAEAVEVEFDPDKVSFADLLTVFWDEHDPTQLNRQGPDVGEQYRSAIFYHSEEQRLAAEASRAELNASGRYRSPAVTEITPATTFWLAEDYHQRYFEKRGLAACPTH